MNVPILGKAKSLLIANKTATVAIAVSLAIIVPTGVYVGVRQSNDQQTTPEQNQPITLSDTSKTEQTTPTTTDNPTEKTTPTTSSTNQSNSSPTTPSTSQNNSSPTTPSTTPSNPTPTTPSNPTPPPYVENWNMVVTSGGYGSGLACGWQSQPCSLNESINLTVNFYDSTTNRQISISSCSGYTKQGTGSNTGHTRPTTMSVLNGKSCVVSVTGTAYFGQYYIWADVNTNENTAYPYKGFNFIHVWFQ